MLPVIAIVGRPNVGKSTLFNCLTKSRDALVADMTGVTRDRHYGEAKLGLKPCLVIDTGGIGEGETGIDLPTKQQAELAMEEANLILFVVDGRTGITIGDERIAKSLRQLNKSIFLVVNKTDGHDENILASEFYRLGFGEPVSIAAAHNRGISQLMDTISADLPEADVSTTNETEQQISVAIIGKPNVGKSTLINRMLGEERVIVYDQAGTTRGSIMIPFTRHDRHYQLIDTAGIRRRGRVSEVVEKFSVIKALQAIESANVIVFVIDARDNITDQDLNLLGFVVDAGRALVIAINKWDGLSSEQKEAIKQTMSWRLNFVNFARIHFISALHGTGIGDLFDFIDEAYAAATQDLSTSRLTNLLEQAVRENPPPLVKGRRIKLRYANPGGHNPPIIVIHGNQTEHTPPSYQRYLINFYRDALHMVGTPLKLQFKTSDNPYKDRRNTLTARQKYQQRRRKKIFK